MIQIIYVIARSKDPHDIYLHIGAFDIARTSDGSFQIIDDNVTIPSGISYAMTNRQVLRQQFPNIFEKASIKTDLGYNACYAQHFKRMCSETRQ